MKKGNIEAHPTAAKKCYHVRIDMVDGREIMVDDDTDEPITGRVSLAGMKFGGASRHGITNKLLMSFHDNN